MNSGSAGTEESDDEIPLREDPLAPSPRFDSRDAPSVEAPAPPSSESPASDSEGPRGGILGRTIVAIVRAYQRGISPLRAPACRFSPTCSQYMIESIQRRGLLRGFAKGVWRILRCHPFSRGGYDPVD